MDIREKLVELLQDGENPVWAWFPNNETMVQLADYLIAHGTTVQKWIPVTERRPDKPMECLAYDKRGDCGVYSIVYYGQGSYIHYSDTCYWMPLPEPPREEIA